MVQATGGYYPADDAKKSTAKYAAGNTVSMPITRSAQFAGSGANVVFSQPMFFSPLHTPQNWQIASKRREVYQWSRFYYENEPKVAAGVDFYSTFPMNGFKLECKDVEILAYFEQLVEDLRLNDWLKHISHEYFLLGDVFPFLEIHCDVCNGKGVKADGSVCEHPDGSFKKIHLLNPDYVVAQKNMLTNDATYSLMPDEELRNAIQRKEPKNLYDSIPPYLRNLISSGRPIALSPRSISHIKHNASSYGTYGTSLLRRLFTILAYKTKLMTANWIVAERLIVPVRVVKVGDKERPATDEDIADILAQLNAVATDPNLTIVTHHAFEYEWFGATGKIHNITAEVDQIGKEILDGFMLNQALLNGEMAGYSSAAVGVETMIHRLDSWRNTLAEWIERHIFLPASMMKGFIDEKKSKRSKKTVYLHPKIKWNDLNLRDRSSEMQVYMQLFDKGILSMQTLCEKLGLNYDQEVERIRQEQLMVSAAGQVPMGGAGGGAGGGMGGGMGGAIGGGMPGGAGGEGGMPPAGGAPGMDATGGAPGMDMAGGGAGMGAPAGAAPAGGMGATASADAGLLIRKGGKGASKKEEVKTPPPKFIKLTTLENKMFKLLKDLQVPFDLFAQYQVKIAGQDQPYVIDFAYPKLAVGIEVDGSIWHDREDLAQRDMQRDQKISNIGWRILRFKEFAVEDHLDTVQKIIVSHVKDAIHQHKKKAETDSEFIKLASEGTISNYFDYINKDNINLQVNNLEDDLGTCYILGK